MYIFFQTMIAEFGYLTNTVYFCEDYKNNNSKIKQIQKVDDHGCFC